MSSSGNGEEARQRGGKPEKMQFFNVTVHLTLGGSTGVCGLPYVVLSGSPLGDIGGGRRFCISWAGREPTK